MGVFPAREKQRGASSGRGTASVPLPEISTCFHARAYIPLPGTLLAEANAPRRRGHIVQPSIS